VVDAPCAGAAGHGQPGHWSLILEARRGGDVLHTESIRRRCLSRLDAGHAGSRRRRTCRRLPWIESGWPPGDRDECAQRSWRTESWRAEHPDSRVGYAGRPWVSWAVSLPAGSAAADARHASPAPAKPRSCQAVQRARERSVSSSGDRCRRGESPTRGKHRRDASRKTRSWSGRPDDDRDIARTSPLPSTRHRGGQGRDRGRPRADISTRAPPRR